jgi:hypothetical protein
VPLEAVPRSDRVTPPAAPAWEGSPGPGGGERSAPRASGRGSVPDAGRPALGAVGNPLPARSRPAARLSGAA